MQQSFSEMLASADHLYNANVKAALYYPRNSVLISCWMNEGYSLSDLDSGGIDCVALMTLSWLDCECDEYNPHFKATVKRERRNGYPNHEDFIMSPTCEKCGACENDGNMPDSRVFDILCAVYGYEFFKTDGLYNGTYTIHADKRRQDLIVSV